MEKLSNNKKMTFFKWMNPILDSLRKLGGSCAIKKVVELIANEHNIPEAKRKERFKSGQLKFAHEITWAGQLLIWDEFIKLSPGDVWGLTEKGNRTVLTEEQAREIFSNWLNINVEERKRMNLIENAKEHLKVGDEVSINENHDKALLTLIKRLPAEGFEKLCIRLLYESGFSKVTITSSGGCEKGIEGIGILQLNPFVSFKVLFQCKQGKEIISNAQIGDLRNAMIGRADKGIIITIGSFSSDAIKEADRDGAPPIELVDGKKLVKMFEKIPLGLTPKTVYDIDKPFFQQFYNPDVN